jgi:hypothetical protein
VAAGRISPSRVPIRRHTTEETRNPGAGSADGELTTNGSPAPAPGVSAPSPPPPSPTAPRPSVSGNNCFVTSGPTYTPSGTIPVTPSGSLKHASFSMAASFGTDAATSRVPRCCEVRQYIKWNAAYHTWRGGPPHSGFPPSSKADEWHEDRDSAGTRYGHRSGRYSSPAAGCGDEYTTGAAQDQANGDTYCGSDAPQSRAPAGAAYNFQLKVVDTCNGNPVKASSSVITVNW